MKITCENCGANYEVEDSKVPASGFTIKCAACLRTFQVGPDRPLGPVLVSDAYEIDLPAPKDPPADLPAPRVEIDPPARWLDETDLPGPRVENGDLPAPKFGETDLPAPKTSASNLPAPKSAFAIPPSTRSTPPPPGQRPGKSTVLFGNAPPGGKPPPLPPPLPTPLKKSAPPAALELSTTDDIIELPTPKTGGAATAPPGSADPNNELLTPKTPAIRQTVSGIGVSLDTPETDDQDLEPARPQGPRAAPPPSPEPSLSIESIDLVERPQEVRSGPIALEPRAPTRYQGQASRSEAKLLEAPPQGRAPAVGTEAESLGMELAPAVTDIAPKPEPELAVPSAAGDPDEADAPTPIAAAESRGEEATPGRLHRWSRILITVGGVLALVSAVGVALGIFTDSGYFGAKLLGAERVNKEKKLVDARQLMAEDTLASYRKAAVELKLLREAQPRRLELQALEAQAHLAVARLGVASEARAAESLLTPLETNPKASVQPDVVKASALKLLVSGKPAEARAKLRAVLENAPSDAVALVYLGWVGLDTGDDADADRAFTRALTGEPNRAGAIYGLAVAKERQGNRVQAFALYQRALGKSPQHFSAAVGLARSSLQSGEEVQAKIEELITQRGSVAAPREIADAWATLGLGAAAAGRREEAADRLRRAVSLDAGSSMAAVGLARLQCDLGRSAEGLPTLRKIVEAEPRNLEARLTLVRALLETGEVGAVAAPLSAAVSMAPQNPRVLYWQGRSALAQPSPERHKALERFKQAATADPKFLDAYLAQSRTYALLGKGDEALAALKLAEAQASGDPQLEIELGETYLALGKTGEAESRFRAAIGKRPDASIAHIDLAQTLEQQGRLDEARAQYEAVAEKQPTYPGLAERRARLALKQGRREEAKKLFDDALKQGVPTTALKLAAAELAFDTGHFEDARRLAESVVKDDDHNAGGHLVLARTLLELHRRDDALPEARRAASLGQAPDAHYVYAGLLESLGKLDQAMSEYSQARRPPREADAALGRARILVHMGATKDALSELATLTKEPRVRARAFLLQGDCYSDQQQFERARHAYEEAVKYGPELGEAAFKLGRAQLDSGKRRFAIDLLERAIKLGGDGVPWAAEAHLLVGDAHRAARENELALRAYRRYLELAPPDARARGEVTRQISLLSAN